MAGLGRHFECRENPEDEVVSFAIGHVRYVWSRRDGTGSNTPSRGRVDYLAYGGCARGTNGGQT